tara:strand:- start:966 stop:1079 length:114 start_codon:yes stop_codon:yes gene_type:complete
MTIEPICVYSVVSACVATILSKELSGRICFAVAKNVS